MIRALAGVLFLVILVGCSAEPPAPTNQGLPPRPQDLPVLDLDPCVLMPRSVLTELRLEPSGRPVKPPSEAPPGTRLCGWGRSILDRPSASVGIGVLPQNAADYLTLSGASQTSTAGFAAVQVPNDFAAAKQSCSVRVDVAPGQALLVAYYNTLGDEPGATHELMCERARRAADGVMRQLLATRK